MYTAKLKIINTASLNLKILIRPHSLLILNVSEKVAAERHRAGYLGLGINTFNLKKKKSREDPLLVLGLCEM